jgi:hypothetical protein
MWIGIAEDVVIVLSGITDKHIVAMGGGHLYARRRCGSSYAFDTLPYYISKKQ